MPLNPMPNRLERDFKSFTCGTKDPRAGITLEFSIDGLPDEGEVLFDSRNAEGAGILLRAISRGRTEVVVSDGRTVSSWASDSDSLDTIETNHVSVIIDGGPKLILFVVNGVLCDGGDERQFGWGRYNPALRTINGASEASVAACVSKVAIHARALLVNECTRKSPAVV
jgi:hypothetical protein